MAASEASLKGSITEVAEILDEVLLHQFCGLWKWVEVVTESIHHQLDLILESVSSSLKRLATLSSTNCTWIVEGLDVCISGIVKLVIVADSIVVRILVIGLALGRA